MSARPTVPQALGALERAARDVDALLSHDGPPFAFDGMRLGIEQADGESALLILHDCLNDLATVREVAEAAADAERAVAQRHGVDRLELVDVDGDVLAVTRLPLGAGLYARDSVHVQRCGGEGEVVLSPAQAAELGAWLAGRQGPEAVAAERFERSEVVREALERAGQA